MNQIKRQKRKREGVLNPLLCGGKVISQTSRKCTAIKNSIVLTYRRTTVVAGKSRVIQRKQLMAGVRSNNRNTRTRGKLAVSRHSLS